MSEFVSNLLEEAAVLLDPPGTIPPEFRKAFRMLGEKIQHAAQQLHHYESLKTMTTDKTCLVCGCSLPPVSTSLLNKLAQIVGHYDDVRNERRRYVDQTAINSFLDDPQVASWLVAMRRADRVPNTRFTRAATDR